MNGNTTRRSSLDLWGYGLFWSWNIIFIAFMVLGFAPRILPELITGAGAGSIPYTFLVYGLILSLIPVGAVVLGVTALRKEPARLFALGYVIEGPLMLMLAIRFFVIRQAPAGLLALMVIAGLGMAAYLWHLLRLRDEPGNRWAGSLRLVGLTLMLFISLYAAAWIAFYAVPLAGIAIRWLGETLQQPGAFLRGLGSALSDLLSGGWLWIPFSVLGFVLLLYTLTLFALAPIVFPLLSIRAWLRNFREQVSSRGVFLPTALVSVTLLAAAALFVVSNRQPQRRAFELLASPPTSQAEAEALVRQKETIRAGLLNAYLAPFRYISAHGEVSHIRWIYEDVFRMDTMRAFSVQRLYEGVARPLLYEPVHPQNVALLQDNRALVAEPQEAAELYQRFFDEPIAEGERDVLVRAARSTWSPDQAESAWQAVDDREVHLLQQDIRVEEHGDWAEIEIFEAYQNRTVDNQEVIYYFNLPESAVLTGVWLGNTPAKEESFPFQVAPRGAAQAVYRNETRRNRDPALLEQIGPRQYRLRVFPVLPLRSRWDEARARSIVEDAPPLYMWLTYTTMADGDSWPLPRLAFKMNVYWDEDSQRSVDGGPMAVDPEEWLPPALAAKELVSPSAHRVDLPGGDSVLATPLSQAALPELPPALRLAVVLDRSQSMSELSAEVAAALERLSELTGGEADVYLTSSAFRGEEPSVASLSEVNPEALLFFGGQNPGELLVQFAELSAGQRYDAVIVLTDGSAYELGAEGGEPVVSDAPVWLVHLAEEIPLGYDDATLEAVQASGGGVTGDLDDALTRMAYSLSGADTGESIFSDVLDGYTWQLIPTEQAGSLAPGLEPERSPDGFAALAARRLVLAEMQRRRGSLDDLETLDRIHALAVEYGIVTPYSSMIVLVNTEQQYLLDKLQASQDRYEREFEELGETAPSTPMPLTGVPEPHEWLLIALAAGLLVYYGFVKRPVPQANARRL